MSAVNETFAKEILNLITRFSGIFEFDWLVTAEQRSRGRGWIHIKGVEIGRFRGGCVFI